MRFPFGLSVCLDGSKCITLSRHHSVLLSPIRLLPNQLINDCVPHNLFTVLSQFTENPREFERLILDSRWLDSVAPAISHTGLKRIVGNPVNQHSHVPFITNQKSPSGCVPQTHYKSQTENQPIVGIQPAVNIKPLVIPLPRIMPEHAGHNMIIQPAQRAQRTDCAIPVVAVFYSVIYKVHWTDSFRASPR